ncbi:MAG: hypothetical protein HOU81_23065 [Hamadaea sp.]|uniref:hypothetical protein n=1 Tax=Hamadaea sp. TaxID=2024425 RepID=UPI001823A286|nr:hypothetical protein [Hamadaea sp.]NUR73706.1 hypothetical protein [Hamadaea sp.]NUT22556.1 hypothetical protein [Hamadaea sp.]
MTEHPFDVGCGEPAVDCGRDGPDYRCQVIPAPTEWLVFLDAIKARRAEDATEAVGKPAAAMISGRFAVP